MAQAHARRRGNGLLDFMDGFNATYTTGTKIARDIETRDIMNEKPSEVGSDTLTDQDYLKEAAVGPVPEKVTQYAGKTYQRPVGERELLGLRTSRLADVAAKYGDAEGALRMRKQAGDMAFEDKTRGRQEDTWQREDTVRGLMSGVDPNKPESYMEVSDKVAQVGDLQSAAALQSAGKTRKDYQASIAAEGVKDAVRVVRGGGTPEQVHEAFNKAGAMKFDAPPTITRTKGADGREVVSLSGTIDGNPVDVPDFDKWVRSTMNVKDQEDLGYKDIEVGLARERSENEKTRLGHEKTRLGYEGDRVRMEERRTTVAEQTARTAEETNRIAREEQRRIRYNDEMAKEEKRRGEASASIDEYSMNSPILYDQNDKGEQVLNKERAAKMRNYINAFEKGQAIKGPDGQTVNVPVNLSNLWRTDPRKAKEFIGLLEDRFLLHEAAEKATGKKLPFFSSLSLGEQTAEDYTKPNGGKGLGFGAATWNAIPGTDSKVVRYGDASVDYSTLIDDNPNSERFRRLLENPDGLAAAVTKLAAPGSDAPKAPQGLRPSSGNPRIDSLAAANTALSEQIAAAGKQGDVATVQRLTEALTANDAELRQLQGR